MNKTFDTLLNMKIFLSEHGIDISISDLTYAIKTGFLFTNDYDFECYYDDIENEYVLEG